MFVKYDENNVITSLFVGCIPENVEEYVEIPDDQNIIDEYINSRKKMVENNQPTQLDIIEAQVAYTAMMTNTLLEA